MHTVDKGQIKTIHTLLAQIGMANDKEYKQNLVGQYTNKRETSTKGLFYAEADALISDLRTMTKWTPEQIKANEKRRLILHYAHEMMWEIDVPGEGIKVDIKRVDNWCISHGYLHKPLNDYTLTELSKLVWQMEQAHQAYLNAV